MNSSKMNSIFNQAIIAFTFDGSTFNIDCHLEGIKPDTHLFHALEANQFVPVYDLDNSSYQFASVEQWQRDLPMFLQYQAH